MSYVGRDASNRAQDRYKLGYYDDFAAVLKKKILTEAGERKIASAHSLG